MYIHGKIRILDPRNRGWHGARVAALHIIHNIIVLDSEHLTNVGRIIPKYYIVPSMFIRVDISEIDAAQHLRSICLAFA